MSESTPKTLEYSTIKRSRKRVVVIVVLVLVSIGLAMLGRGVSGRVYTTFGRYSDERKHRIALDRDIESIRDGSIRLDSTNDFRVPLFDPLARHWRYMSSGWLNLRSTYSALTWTSMGHVPPDEDKGWDSTTACLARLDSGKGPRYVGVDLTLSWTWTTPSRALTARIAVVTEPTFFQRAKTLHDVELPVITFGKSLSVIPGTATHPDRATFKLIADGQEKTFVVILKKDDTIEFSELTP